MVKIKKKICEKIFKKFCKFIDQEPFFSGYIMKGFLCPLCNVS